MQTVIYRGELEELQGSKWEVPDSVPLTGRKAWIESQHREAQLQAAAEAERQEREQQVLAARLEKAKNDATFERLSQDIQELAGGLAELNERIVEEPDTSAQLQFNAAAADIYARNLQLADEVKTMQETVSDLLNRTTAMAEATKEGERLQQQAIELLRNNQAMVNGAFETYRLALDDLQSDTDAAAVAVGELNTSAQDHRETIVAAANLSNEAKDIARQEAKQATDAAMDEVLAVLSTVLEIIGIDESTLNQQLNADEVRPSKGVFLSREYVSRILSIYGSKKAVRTNSFEGPLL